MKKIQEFESIRGMTNNFSDMKKSIPLNLSKDSDNLKSPYIEYTIQGRFTFTDVLDRIGVECINNRYFLTYRLQQPNVFQAGILDLDYIYTSLICYLKTLITHRHGGKIKNVSVLFVTDCASKYLDLFSLFEKHVAWGSKFKKTALSVYCVCTKTGTNLARELSPQEQQMVAHHENNLKKMHAKFKKDLHERYVLVITTYVNNKEMFNNLGQFRQYLFHHFLAVSLQ